MKSPNRIREIREAKGWTARQLAEKTGLWTPQIYEYEKGNVVPGFVNLRVIAEALEVSIEELEISRPAEVAK